MSVHISDHDHGEDIVEIDEMCGYPAGSFACRIRHIHLNTGDAKAARDA